MKELTAWPEGLAPPLPRFPAGPSGLQGPGGDRGKSRGFGSLEVSGRNHTLRSSVGSSAHPPFLRPPRPLLLSLVTRIPSRNFFFLLAVKQDTTFSPQKGLWGLLGGRSPVLEGLIPPFLPPCGEVDHLHGPPRSGTREAFLRAWAGQGIVGCRWGPFGGLSPPGPSSPPPQLCPTPPSSLLSFLSE